MSLHGYNDRLQAHLVVGFKEVFFLICLLSQNLENRGLVQMIFLFKAVISDSMLVFGGVLACLQGMTV